MGGGRETIMLRQERDAVSGTCDGVYGKGPTIRVEKITGSSLQPVFWHNPEWVKKVEGSGSEIGEGIGGV